MYHLPLVTRQQRDGHGDHPLPGPSVRGFYPHESFPPHHRTWQERLALVVYSEKFLILAVITLWAASVIGLFWLGLWVVRNFGHYTIATGGA